eukprot:jgi/Picsp_1/1513/NSC_04991-R1_hedgehog
MRLLLLWMAVVGLTALLFEKSDAGRDLRWDGSCSSARVECANKCSGDIATFDCDPSFFGIDSGSYYCTCGTLGSVKSCFAGSGLVSTPAGGKRIKDVTIGDQILTVNRKGEPVFAPVFSFSSRRPQQQTPFVRITTEGNKTVLVTPSHYMFTATDNGSLDPNVHHWSYVPAKMLKPGNTVAVFADSTISPALIKDISIENSVGVFMPHTASGAIIVDGIVATELTTFVPIFLASSGFHQAAVRAVSTLHNTGLGLTSSVIKSFSVLFHGMGDAIFDGSVLRRA